MKTWIPGGVRSPRSIVKLFDTIILIDSPTPGIRLLLGGFEKMKARNDALYTQGIQIQSKRVRNEAKHLQFFLEQLEDISDDDPKAKSLQVKANELASMLAPDAEMLFLLMREYGAFLSEKNPENTGIPKWIELVESSRTEVLSSERGKPMAQKAEESFSELLDNLDKLNRNPFSVL